MSLEAIWYGHATTKITSLTISPAMNSFFEGNHLATNLTNDIHTDVIEATHGHNDHHQDSVVFAKCTEDALTFLSDEKVSYLTEQGLVGLRQK